MLGGGGWREQGLRVQAQIVLTSEGGSWKGRFLLVQRRAPWEGEKSRRPHNESGVGQRAGVTEWIEDVRQWMSGCEKGDGLEVEEVLLTESNSSCLISTSQVIGVFLVLFP